MEKDDKKRSKLRDLLHNKNKLPSLRTYQGDVAEFIKEKNHSTISIAVEEKERKEKEERYKPDLAEKKNNNFQVSLTMIFLSLFLIFGGGMVLFYVFKFLGDKPANQVQIEEKIIPYNNIFTLANTVNKNLSSDFLELPISNGVNVVKISDLNGKILSKISDFLDFLEIAPPFDLKRILKDEYETGLVSKENKKARFLVIKVTNFEVAFSAMLQWEENMEEDLAFLTDLKTDSQISPVSDNQFPVATSTGVNSISEFKPPLIPKKFSWKDIVVKNKDVRALIDDQEKSKIAYTFLDKNTILITDQIFAIEEISSAYASRFFTR